MQWVPFVKSDVERMNPFGRSLQCALLFSGVMLLNKATQHMRVSEEFLYQNIDGNLIFLQFMRNRNRQRLHYRRLLWN